MVDDERRRSQSLTGLPGEGDDDGWTEGYATGTLPMLRSPAASDCSFPTSTSSPTPALVPEPPTCSSSPPSSPKPALAPEPALPRRDPKGLFLPTRRNDVRFPRVPSCESAPHFRTERLSASPSLSRVHAPGCQSAQRFSDR